MAQYKRLSPATALIVENEVLVRTELAYIVSQAGLLVVEAGDADEAIRLLDSHPEIEVMVTDIRMPGSMDGIRLAHHVRHRWPPVQIIIASGRLETELSELPAGSDFIAKPFSHEAIEAAVRRMTELSSARHGGHWAA
jgi:DNA-binding NtrC family response regulator